MAKLNRRLLPRELGKRRLYRALLENREHGRRFASVSELAEHLGVTKQAISSWKKIPAKWCWVFHELLGLHPHALRPDRFPPPDEGERWNANKNYKQRAARGRR